MATLHAFDTLAYAETLTKSGFERDKAEALARAQRDYFVEKLVTEDFFKHEIEKVNNNIEKVSNKIDTEVGKLSSKVDTEVEKLSSKVDTEVEKLSSKVDAEVEKLSSKVDAEVGKLSAKIDKTALELKNEISELKIWTGKMLVSAVSFMTAGIPIILTVIQKLLG